MEKKSKNNRVSSATTENTRSTSRRRFLRAGVGTGFLSAASTFGVSRTANAQSGIWDFLGLDDWFDNDGGAHSLEFPNPGETNLIRADQDDRRRVDLSTKYLRRARQLEDQERNFDEPELADKRYYASFSKCLPSNNRAEVNPEAYEALLGALDPQGSQDFSAIPLASIADRKLANPQGALQFQSSGLDGHATRMPASFGIQSAELAGEMVEVYWQALTRDVPYSDYLEDPLINSAASDLNQLSARPAQTAHSSATPQNLFRGETPGDLAGPYISQFLWKDYSFGSIDVVQKYQTPKRNQDFMTKIPEWRQIQKGKAPDRSIEFAAQKRYIFNARSLGEYVHRDVSFQAYQQAALILLQYGPAALAPGNPYLSSSNQGGFVSHGVPFIMDMVSRAAQAALHAAWYQKWVVHRVLRPECFGGRVHFKVQEQADYDIHEDLLNSGALRLVHRRQNNYLLSQAYPEGSPTHPSYPAGHGCVAGACVTMLKALFNGSFVIPDPVVAANQGRQLVSYSGDTLTVAGELNKLASNIALGRDAAGVHYRQDGIQGIRLGEQVAIALLEEAAAASSEPGFAGYRFTRFDGTTQEISSDF